MAVLKQLRGLVILRLCTYGRVSLRESAAEHKSAHILRVSTITCEPTLNAGQSTRRLGRAVIISEKLPSLWDALPIWFETRPHPGIPLDRASKIQIDHRQVHGRDPGSARLPLEVLVLDGQFGQGDLAEIRNRDHVPERAPRVAAAATIDQ